MASAGRPPAWNAAARPTRHAAANGCGSTPRRASRILEKWRTASAGRPASSAAMAAVRRRSRSLTCARSWDTASDSMAGMMNADPDLVVFPEGIGATAAAGEEEEKLSSDRHTLSRRNAAEARRRPVWRSTMASSISPRWKQAWPRTKFIPPLGVRVGILGEAGENAALELGDVEAAE
ncbi:Os03g0304550 [Oryza sativa Japonica Group]|uniref:Os03g0304550 protein n=1 Tax=Oryza sativa subsp. japonica TaxID=39947 RepID=A0A0P0VX76_ORYSJ|nr:hypothetical protein EE612_016927 [Oryza sativa]BAS83794.1 Os03g0304550 [Oryza sativa Japonica Group]